MGSAGAKVISVVRDVTDAYVHAGGQYEWDSAAPVAVARAAGLFTSRVDGSPLRYNQDDVYLPDLVVCRPELAERILAHLREHGVAGRQRLSRPRGGSARRGTCGRRSPTSSDQDQLSTYCRSRRTVSSQDEVGPARDLPQPGHPRLHVEPAPQVAS